jgi:3-dehydroquinate dehydratase I
VPFARRTAIDGTAWATIDCGMAKQEINWLHGNPKVVGSFGSTQDLLSIKGHDLSASCDLVEIRLDRLAEGAVTPDSGNWRNLGDAPRIFTARSMDEGGALPLDAAQRATMLEAVLDDAACIDIEVASIDGMKNLLDLLDRRGIPWVASFHDFKKLPSEATLAAAARRAKDAGAAVFKAAAMLNGPADLCRLADFQRQDHGIPTATMGMGTLAAVSRLLCAQSGSVLNYGYLGLTPTAPGQWPCRLLKEAIALLPSLHA